MKKKLQVFVSSTFQDLRAERQAAVEAILKAAHIPAGMELFAAGDKSQMEVIRRWIDESDVYMLILGGRYGSIDSETNKSYIELEYDYAEKAGKPLFAAVLSDKSLEVRRLGPNADQVFEQKRIEQFMKFRARVLGKMSRIYDDEKDIRLAVYETLGDFTQNRDFPGGWVSAREVSEPKPLVEEIARLREENGELRKQVEAAKKRSLDSAFPDAAQIIAAMRAETIELPPEVVGRGSARKTDLYSLFVSVGEWFAGGQVTNNINTGAAAKHVFTHVAPNLAVFGLVERQRAPSRNWDQFALTKLGAKILADEKMSTARRAASKPAVAADGPQTEKATPAAPPRKPISLRRKK